MRRRRRRIYLLTLLLLLSCPTLAWYNFSCPSSHEEEEYEDISPPPPPTQPHIGGCSLQQPPLGLRSLSSSIKGFSSSSSFSSSNSPPPLFFSYCAPPPWQQNSVSCDIDSRKKWDGYLTIWRSFECMKSISSNVCFYICHSFKRFPFHPVIRAQKAA